MAPALSPHVGSDVTVVGWGSQLYVLERAIEAVERLRPGASCELIDLRSILPWDRETILRVRTRRCPVLSVPCP